MGIYTLTLRDGSRVEVEAPPNTSPEELARLASAQLAQQSPRARMEERRAERQRQIDADLAAAQEAYVPPPEEPGFLDYLGEIPKGIAAGAVGLGKTAALGAITPLGEETETAAREAIMRGTRGIEEYLAPDVGLEESIPRKFSEALGSFVPLAAASLIPGVGLVIAGGAATAAGAGEASERARAAGATEEQRGIAALLGAPVGISEMLPIFRLQKVLGRRTTGELVDRLKRAAAQGGVEGLQEAAANTAQNLIERGVYNPEQGVFADTGESFGYGAGVGAFVQGLMDLVLPRSRATGAPPPQDLPRLEEGQEQGELFGALPFQTAPGATDVVRPPEETPGYQGELPLGPTERQLEMDLRTAMPSAQGDLFAPEGGPALESTEDRIARFAAQRDRLARQREREREQEEFEAALSTVPEEEQRAQAAARERLGLQAAERGDVEAFEQPDLFALELEQAERRLGRPEPRPTEPEAAPEAAPEGAPLLDLIEQSKREEADTAELMRMLEAEQEAQTAATAERAALRRESEMETLAGRPDTQAREAKGRRYKILQDVIARTPSRQERTLSRAFSAALEQAGIARVEPTERELATIRRAVDVQRAERPPAPPMERIESPPGATQLEEMEARIPEAGRVRPEGPPSLPGFGRRGPRPQPEAAPAPEPRPVTTEMLDQLGVAKSAPIRKRTVGKDLNDPAVRKQFVDFANNTTVPQTTRLNVARFLENVPEAQLELFQPRRGGRRGPDGRTTQPEPPPSGGGPAGGVRRPDVGGRAADVGGARGPAAPAGGGLGGAGRGAPRADAPAGAQPAALAKPAITAPITPAPKRAAAPAPKRAAEPKKAAEPAGTTRKVVPTLPRQPLIDKRTLKPVPEERAGRTTKALAPRERVPLKVKPKGKTAAELSAAEKAANKAAQAKLDEQFESTASPELKAMNKTLTRERGADPTTAGDKKKILTLLQSAVSRAKDAAAAFTYFSKIPRPIDALGFIAYDVAFSPAQFKPQDGVTAGQRAFYRGLASKNVPSMGRTAALRAVKWAQDNLSPSAKAWLDKRLADELDDVQRLAEIEEGIAADTVALAREAAEGDVQKFLDLEAGLVDVAAGGSIRGARRKTGEVPTIDRPVAKALPGRSILEGLSAEERAAIVAQYLPLMSDSTIVQFPAHPTVLSALQDGNLRDALGALAATAPSNRIASLAAKLQKYAGDTKIEIVDDLKAPDGRPASGLFDPKTNTIKLDSKRGMNAHTVLHETTHAAVSATLANKNHPLTRQLQALYDNVKDELSTFYGSQNLDEFASEGMSNHLFQQELARINVKGEPITAWQRFSSAVANFLRKMVGAQTKPPAASALSELDQLLDTILAPAPQYRNAGALYQLSSHAGAKRIMNNLGKVQKALYKKSPKVEEMAFELERVLGGTAPEKVKSLALQFLPMNLLVDIASFKGGKVFGVNVSNLRIPGAKDLERLFNEQRAKIGVENDRINATITSIAKWANANPNKVTTLNKLWPKATLGVEVADGKRLGVDPAKPRDTYKGNKAQLTLWDEMQPEWRKLGSDGQAIYKQVRDSYAKLFDRVIDVIGGTVEVYIDDKAVQAQFRTEVLKKLADMAGRVDPYFPLFREGDYWLEFTIKSTAKDNPGEYVIKAFDTPGARRKFIESLRESKDVVDSSIKELERPENISFDRAPPSSFIAQTLKILSKNKVPDAVQKEIMRTVIAAMPETSFVKSLQSRKGHLGFEEDLLYAFRNKAPQLAQQAVRLEYGAKIRTVENKMREEKLQGSARLVRDEFIARAEFARNPPRDGIAETANRLAFLYTIGGNVSSAATQLFSMPVIVYPYLGGKYGYIEAGAAIKDATRLLAGSGLKRRIRMTAPNGKVTSVDSGAAPALDNYYEMDDKGNLNLRKDLKKSPEVRKELEEIMPMVSMLMDRGQLHRSLLADTIGLKDAYNDRTPWERVNAISAFLFHQSDQFNRQVTAIAAYKLALKNPDLANLSRDERRKRAAEQAIYETQLTNGGTVLETAPRIAQQGVGRVAMMYKSYGISVNYLLLKTARSAVDNMFAGNKEQSKAAFRQLVGVFGSTVLLAGVQGLPLFGVYTMIANLFLDDDEDDAETLTRKAIGEGWYKGALAELSGVDLSARIGLSNLIFQANRYNRDPSFEEQVAYVFGGPALSVASRFYRGVQDVGEGNLVRGVEQMVPTAVANAIKGTFRYPSEDGVLTRRGDPIYSDISSGELLAQAMGFAPTEYTFRQEQNAAAKGLDIAANRRRSRILKKYYVAMRMGDFDGANEAMEEMFAFNRRHPTAAITPATIDRSMQQHMRTSAEMYNGISISASMRAAITSSLAEWQRGF